MHTSKETAKLVESLYRQILCQARCTAKHAALHSALTHERTAARVRSRGGSFMLKINKLHRQELLSAALYRDRRQFAWHNRRAKVE